MLATLDWLENELRKVDLTTLAPDRLEPNIPRVKVGKVVDPELKRLWGVLWALQKSELELRDQGDKWWQERKAEGKQPCPISCSSECWGCKTSAKITEIFARVAIVVYLLRAETQALIEWRDMWVHSKKGYKRYNVDENWDLYLECSSEGFVSDFDPSHN